MTKIITHPSLTIKEQGENRLGLELIARLKERFPFSDEQLCSDEFYLEDLRKSLSRNDVEKYTRLMQSAHNAFQGDLLEIPDNEMAILLWGSGDVHFITQYISLKKDAYKKVNFDRHRDDSALRNQELMFGIIPARFESWVFLEKRSNPNFTDYAVVNRTELCDYENEDIHITVDLDVISGFPARWDWQHDNPRKKLDINGISLDNLLEKLDGILSKNRLRRFDLGGLHTPKLSESRFYDNPKVNNPNIPKNFEFAVRCYSAVLDLVYSHLEK